MHDRDRRDSTRSASPLVQDDTYREIDTSDLAVEEVVERMAAAVEER
jgi:cytidylate kinase